LSLVALRPRRKAGGDELHQLAVGMAIEMPTARLEAVGQERERIALPATSVNRAARDEERAAFGLGGPEGQMTSSGDRFY